MVEVDIVVVVVVVVVLVLVDESLTGASLVSIMLVEGKVNLSESSFKDNGCVFGLGVDGDVVKIVVGFAVIGIRFLLIGMRSAVDAKELGRRFSSSSSSSAETHS